MKTVLRRPHNLRTVFSYCCNCFKNSIPSFRQCHDRKRYRAFQNSNQKNSLPKPLVSGAFFLRNHTPEPGREAGSLTVEAALALPLFLFAAGLFFSLFSAQLLQLRLQKALDGITEDVAVWSYAVEFADQYTGTDLLTLADGGVLSGALTGNGEDISTLLSQEGNLPEEIKLFLLEKGSALLWQQFVKQWLIRRAGEEKLRRSVLLGGPQGLSLSGSTLHGRELDLILSYRIAPLFGRTFGITIPVVQRRCRRLWIGTRVAEEESGEEEEQEPEEIVYVTESGTVYHRSRDCRVFHIDPVSVLFSVIPSLRNKDGKKYYPCGSCTGIHPEPLIVWITDFGVNYHFKKDCPGLKRTLIEIALSEAQEKYRPCGFCGGAP